MRRDAICITASLLWSCTLLQPAFSAPDAGWASIEKLVAVVSNWKGEKSDPAVNAQAAKYIDYQTMSERALGAPQWDKLTAKQKQQFTATLKTLMEQRYYPRWHRIFSKGKLEHVSDSSAEGDTLVKTNLIVGKKTDSLVWRTAGKGGDGKVVSLAIGDRDLLNKLKVRLQDKLKKSNFTGLLSWMQAKAKQESAVADESTEAVIGEK